METNIKENISEIYLSSIDWNKLSTEEFYVLEQKMIIKQKLAKSQKRKVTRDTGSVLVSIRGNQYCIKKVTYNRLIAMKSDKSKEKLIEEIISSQNIIENV